MSFLERRVQRIGSTLYSYGDIYRKKIKKMQDDEYKNTKKTKEYDPYYYRNNKKYKP